MNFLRLVRGLGGVGVRGWGREGKGREGKGREGKGRKEGEEEKDLKVGVIWVCMYSTGSEILKWKQNGTERNGEEWGGTERKRWNGLLIVLGSIWKRRVLVFFFSISVYVDGTLWVQY